MHKTNFLLIIFIFSLWAIACQTRPNVMSVDYTVEKQLNPESSHIFAFQAEHELNMTAYLHTEKVVNDTLFYIAFSTARNPMYILNCRSNELRTISFDHLKNYGYYGVTSFYYHNHDSIFLFLNRFSVAASNKIYHNNLKDILLVNGKGELLCRYSIDSIPQIYYDSIFYGCLYPWEENLDERLFADGFLIDLTPKIPKEFCNLPLKSPITESKIIAFCKLSDHSLRLLNIQRPAELYKKFEYPSETWIKVLNTKEILLGFSSNPNMYRYNIDTDTLLPLNARYDYTFFNTDSASMTKGKDYPSIVFQKPIWRASDTCYVRNIRFRHYKNYKSFGLVEILDTNFNHIGYVYADKKRGWYDARCHSDGSITVADKGRFGRHKVSLTGKIHKIRLKTLERRGMEEKILQTSGKSKPLRFSQFLQTLQIPDSNVSIVINLKYPCGPCLETLCAFYKKEQQVLEKYRIFYVFYDPETENDTAVSNLIKNHGIHNAHNIRIDHKLLQKVPDILPNGREAQYTQFLILDFRTNNLFLGVPTFKELMAALEQMVEKYKTDEKH